MTGEEATEPRSPGAEGADREKRFVALSSVVAAVFLTSMKVAVGVATGSLGILSEAAHSALDLVAAAVTFWAVRISGKPADPEHTYGHAKFENLSALTETLLLLVTCVWIVYEAVERLFFRHVDVEASVWAFVVMGISIVIDVSRSRALERVARKYGSQALEADALHFSTDVWSSSVVIVGLAFVFLSQRLGEPWLVKADAVAALGVAGIVIVVSFRLGKKSIDDLLDTAPPGLRDRLLEAARVPGVIDVKKLRVRRAGPETFADVTLTVGRDVAFEKAHDISEAVRLACHELLGGGDVVVHVEPVGTGREGIVTTARFLSARHSMGAHHIEVTEADGRASVELRLEVDETLTLRAAHERVREFEEELRGNAPEIGKIVTHIDPTGGRPSLQRPELVDDRPIRKALEAICMERPGLTTRGLAVKKRRMGDGFAVSFVLQLAPSISIAEAHAVREDVEREIRARISGVDRVVIHVAPIGEEPPEG